MIHARRVSTDSRQSKRYETRSKRHFASFGTDPIDTDHQHTTWNNQVSRTWIIVATIMTSFSLCIIIALYLTSSASALSSSGGYLASLFRSHATADTLVPQPPSTPPSNGRFSRNWDP